MPGKKSKPSFSGRTICCCAPCLLACSPARLPCSGRAQKNALYHLTIIINSVCPVSSIDRPPRGTVRLRIEPTTPPLSTWRQGPSKRLSAGTSIFGPPKTLARVVAQRSQTCPPTRLSQPTNSPRPSSPTINILKRPSERESTTANVRLNPSHAGQAQKLQERTKNTSQAHGTCGKREAGIESNSSRSNEEYV